MFASAGDFGVYDHREALRVMLTIAAYGEQETSPLADEVFALPYPQQSARIYGELLGRLPELLDHPDRYRALWEEEDARIAADEARVHDGTITISEDPRIDLAVVKGPTFAHEVAVNNTTRRFRVLQIAGRRYELRMRYETWVAYVSEPTMPRVDLSPLAEQLSAREDTGSWRFDGIESIVPRLGLRGAEESSIPPEEFEASVVEFLRVAG
jgi:hypothetical protein